MKAGLSIALLLGLTATLSGCGLAAPSQNPGFADFKYPRHLGLERDTEISIGRRLLSFTGTHLDDNPEAQAVLTALDGVRIGVYRVTEPNRLNDIKRELARTAAALEDASWQPLARINDRDSQVHVLAKLRSNSMLGLAILVADAEELVFLNVMGDLNEDVLARLPAAVPGGDAFSLKALSYRP